MCKEKLKARINKAIEYCEEVLENYDNGGNIDDIDVAHIIEILKGRE
jgi:hypothetical protein